MTDRIDQQLGNYRLVRLLGRGGFAEVYLGEHQRLKTQAAIKVLRTQLADDDVEGFLDEARMIAHLEHAHIVRVLDFDVEKGTPFLVMSYAPYGNLRQLHGKGIVLPLNVIVSYVQQVSSALQYAHDEKVIHRDIKPENMLVGRHGEVLLSDFGIALMTQSSHLQSTQEVIGTAAYMAPEQFQGKPRKASDQYALGIVVYEWLSGERPFQGNFTELFSQHMFVPPPLLHAKTVTIPLAIEQVVMTALAKDPKERFSSVQAFAQAFEQVYQSSRSIRSHTVTQLPQMPSPLPSQALSSTKEVSAPLYTPLSGATNVVTSPQQGSRLVDSSINIASTSAVTPPVRRKESLSGPQLSKRGISRRAVVVGLVGLVVAGSGVTWLVQSQKSQGSSTTLSSSFPALTSSPQAPSPPITYLSSPLFTYRGHSNSVSAVAWSPDGKRIASGSYDNTVQVWNAVDGSSRYTFNSHDGAVNAVVWSPNGKLIASGGGDPLTDTTIYIWNAFDGTNIPVHYPNPTFISDVQALAWSRDGKSIASGTANAFDNGTIQIWDAVNESLILTYKDSTDSVLAVAWSPDGERIASGSESGSVQVWNAADGSLVFTYRGHASWVQALAWSPDGKRIASGSTDKTVQIWQPS